MSSRAPASLRAVLPRTTSSSGSSSSWAMSGSKKPSTVTRTAAGRARLGQVHREHVEVLLLLGEEQPAKRHLAARLAHGQLQVLAHEVAAQQRGQPVAVGVAADADEAGGDVEHLPRPPVLDLGEAAA